MQNFTSLEFKLEKPLQRANEPNCIKRYFEDIEKKHFERLG